MSTIPHDKNPLMRKQKGSYIMLAIQKLLRQLALSENTQTFQYILRSLWQQDTLWAAFSETTKNCYTDLEYGQMTAYVFSEEVFYKEFEEKMAKKHFTVTSIPNEAKLRPMLFNDIKRCGIQRLMVDSGQELNIAISIIDLFPDRREDDDKENQVFMNPNLLGRMNYYQQQVAAHCASTADETAMLCQFPRASFLQPVMEQNGERVAPVLNLSDGRTAAPFFTDLDELRRFDTEGQYKALIVKFDTLAQACLKADTLLINPATVGMLLDDKLVSIIQQIADGTYVSPNENITMDMAKFSDPDESTDEMQQKIAAMLKEYRRVSAAYLMKANFFANKKTVHLFVLNVTGEAEEIFEDVIEAAKPYANGMDVECVSYEDNSVKDVIESKTPFYKRKKFWLFG